MEIKLSEQKIHIHRKSSKPSLGKLFTQRKSNPLLQPSIKQSQKLPIIEYQKQNPIRYLESLQQNHKQIQKNLQQSFLTQNKWRSYNSPNQSPLNQSLQKQNIFLQSFYTKRKQLSAIKVYNHINNEKQISTKNFDQPQFLQFIQQAVSKSTKKPHLITNNLNSGCNTKRISKIKKGFDIKQNYTIGDHRKQLQNLQVWIKSKVQSYQSSETEGEMMFVQRINFLNMAFAEVSRIAGTFSTQTKHIIEYLHKKYYDYYNFLTECMIEQNRKIKAQISIVEDRLLKTINYYEDKIKKYKQQNEQKSQKIVINFQKCIDVKKKLQKQNKEYKRNYNNEKKKTKLIEQALIKVITLFLALGQKNIQQMTFSLNNSVNKQNNQYIKSSMLAKSRKHILTQQQRQIQKRKQIFQQWCGYLIKMIHRILIKDICHKQNIDIQNVVFKKQVFQIIKQYMVENDDSLSLADADKILNNFLSTQEEELKLKKQIQNGSNIQKQLKQKNLKQLEHLNRKFQNMYTDVSYQLPTFQEVYNKISVHDIDVQVNFKIQTQAEAVQTYIQRQDTGIMAFPRMKSKQIDVSSNLKQKNQIQSGVIFYAETFKVKKQKQHKQIKKTNQSQIRYKTHKNQDLDEIKQNSNHKQQMEGKQYSQNSGQNNHKLSRITGKISLSDLVEISHYDGNFQQIGINTIMTRINSKSRTVQFNIPSYQNQNELQRDTLNSEDNGYSNQNIQYKNLDNKTQNKLSQFSDSIKDLDNDVKSNQGSTRKFIRGKRKNGFLITGDRKKSHLSQKFIPNQSQSSIQSDISIKTDDQNSISPNSNIQASSNNDQKQKNKKMIDNMNEPLLIKRQTSLCSDISAQNRLSLQRSGNFDKSHKKYQNFEQKLNLNRSFFNLSHVEYATKQDADVHRIKDYVIRVPKKKTFRQKFLIDPYDFHLELAFKNKQKFKFLSSVTLWHPKLMFEMKKIRHRVNNIKPFPQMDNKNMNLLKGYFTHIINPLLKDFLKSYCHELNNDNFDFGQTPLMSSTFKGFKNMSLKKLSESSSGFDKNRNLSQQLSYNQRLSPLLYNVINFTQYHQNKTSSDNQIFFSGLKTLKNKNSKMEVYNILIEGHCVQIDIFIKTLYQFNLTVNSNISYDPEISYFILQTGLIEICQGYFTTGQVSKIILESKNFIIYTRDNLPLYRRSSVRNEQKRDSVRNASSPKKVNQNSKITLFDFLVIVFKHLKQKQQVQIKKYSIINEVISRNSECIYYEDIMHFLQCLPIQNDKRKKILDNCLKNIVYWSSSQPTVPKDIFFFILDKYQLYASNNGFNQNLGLIKQYIVNRTELYFKGTLQKVAKNPEWVLTSTYILSYKIPKLFHRISHQIKTGKNFKQRKLLLSLLTLIFCNLIDVQMDKQYMPSLFNGLIAIPLA